MTQFEKDSLDFILYHLCEEKSAELYYCPNNITATYYAMELFKKKIDKHPFIFKLFFKIH